MGGFHLFLDHRGLLGKHGQQHLLEVSGGQVVGQLKYICHVFYSVA